MAEAISNLKASSFCVFCYRSPSPINSATTEDGLIVNEELQTTENNLKDVVKFIKFVDRFAQAGRMNGGTTMDSLELKLISSLNINCLGCCEHCKITAESFCEMYHQFKCLEMQLEWKLNKLVKIMKMASKVPSRKANVNKVLNEHSESDLGGSNSVSSKNLIHKFRHKVIKICRQRLSNSKPFVLLKRNKSTPSPPPILQSLQVDQDSTLETNTPTARTHEMPSNVLTTFTEEQSSILFEDSLLPEREPDWETSSNHGAKDNHVDELSSITLKIPGSIPSCPPSTLQGDQNNTPEIDLENHQISVNALPAFKDNEKTTITEGSVPPESEPGWGTSSNHCNDDDHIFELSSMPFDDNEKSEEHAIDTKLEFPSTTYNTPISTKEVATVPLQHVENLITQPNPQISPQTMTFECKICSKQYAYEYSLKRHTKKAHSSRAKSRRLGHDRLNVKKVKPHAKPRQVGTFEHMHSERVEIQQPMEHVKEEEANNSPGIQRYNFREKRQKIFSNVEENEKEETSDMEYTSSSSELDNKHESCDDDEETRIEPIQNKKRKRKDRNDFSHITSSDGTLLKCKFCAMEKDNAQDLVLHEREHAPEDDNSCKKRSCCPRCRYRYNTVARYIKHHLSTHLNLLAGDRTTACNICSSDRLYVKKSRSHFRIHHKTSGLDPSEIYTCDQCPAYFIKGFQLQRHKFNVHNPDLKCTKCDKTFNKREHLYKHKKHVHKVDDEDPSLPIPCRFPECRKRFGTKEEMDYHGKYSCDQKINPIKKKSVDQNSTTCKKCDKKYSSVRQLQAHMYVVHSDRNHVCHECGKAFKVSESLQIHMKYHRGPDSWAFQCSTCGKKCTSNSKLNEHMRTHTKEKRFICQYCGEKYAHRHNWRGHLIAKHGDEEGVDEIVNMGQRKGTGNYLSRKGFKKGDNVLAGV